ncbi:MAG: ABC transporter permease subunit [Actinomycetota bacterium]|nr:ABC transporter permease subunit [Actinomycetota bacterium]
MTDPAPLQMPSSPPDGTAEILDRGYRRYDGPRNGRSGAVLALFTASVQRALGLRRSFRHKIVPLISAVIAYIPAIVFVGVAALLPGELASEVTVDYSGYYGFITAAIVLFAAITGPEVLCVDRKTGMLGLYLASPLTRDTYLVAKAGALVATVSIVTLGPPLLLLAGYSFVDLGPEGIGDLLVAFGRIVLAGIVIAALLCALALAVAAVTPRKGFAAAAIILVLLVSSIMTGILIDVADAPEWLNVLNLFFLPFDVVSRIYGESQNNFVGVSNVVSIGAYVAWTAGFAAFTRFRYHRLMITR